MDTVITAKVEVKDEEDKINPNVVKVVTDNQGNALYFSRSQVPYNRSGTKVKTFKHLGIYGYPKDILMKFVSLPASTLEQVEMLEQLRLLENGFKLKVVETTYEAVGVDTPEDLEKVEKILGGQI